MSACFSPLAVIALILSPSVGPSVGFLPARIRQHPWYKVHFASRRASLPLDGNIQNSAQSAGVESVVNALTFVEDLLQEKLGQVDREAILARVDHQHIQDCISSQSLAMEDDEDLRPINKVDYDWIQVKDHKLAIRSLEPILNLFDITLIRQAAEQQWRNPAQGAKSRFTYQRPGNYEAHVSDLGPKVKEIMNDALLSSIYPMIRQAFWDEPSSRLCVYDALIIRYNATEAQEASEIGAGQPLHRDLGIVSVNIMLNSADHFQGGGTLFENQLHGNDISPLKPLGVGHCLAHYSAERHAGASTKEGVRDIMVIFVTAEKDPAPSLLRNAWLKQCREQCATSDEVDSVICRIMHQTLAVQMVLNDGEAFQYLGTALMDYAKLLATKNTSEMVSTLEAAIQCLEHASILTPCDARIFNNLGLALGRLSKCSKRVSGDSIMAAYQRGIQLLEKSGQAGCDVEDDLNTIILNYGLYLSNQDRFRDAADVLQALAMRKRDGIEKRRVVEDAYQLWKFCGKKTIV